MTEHRNRLAVGTGQWRWLWPLALALLATAQPACEDEASTPACPFAGDGVCDEPSNCKLGSDEQDCVAACQSGENLQLFAAACAHRWPVEPAADDGDPSGGSLHLSGHRDDSIAVASGEDPNRSVQRHYRLFVPQAYDPGRAAPLVIVMGGHRVSHDDLASYTQIATAADLNRFIVAYADQEWRTKGEQRWAWWTDWNWTTKPDQNPDLDFLRKLIERIASEYNVDRRRVVVSGHSRGGAMAFIAALELSDVVAGAVVQSGFTEFGYLDKRLSSWQERKATMYFVHGEVDTDVKVSHADAMVARLRELGWVDGEQLIYQRLGNVAHRWQPWLNQQWWDFMRWRPLPLEEP